MKMYSFKIVVTQDKNGMYVAHVPCLPGCHTQAEDLSKLDENIKEAIKLYLEVFNEDQNQPDKFTVIPVHSNTDLGIGLLKRIMKDLGINKKELFKMIGS